MQTHATGESAGPAANAYVVRYAYSIDTAMDAGRFFQARVLRWYYAILTAGFLGGAAIVFLVPRFLEIGLWAVLFCGPMLVLLHFSVLGRLLGRRHYRSLLGKVIEIKVGEDGIAWEGPLWTGAAPWTTVTEVRANDRTVLFIGDRILLCFVPAGSFANATEQADVVSYARRHSEAVRIGRAGSPPPTAPPSAPRAGTE